MISERAIQGGCMESETIWRLVSAGRRALRSLQAINAVAPDPQIEGAIEELERAIKEAEKMLENTD